MPFPIEQKLVVAIASSALFDLSESDRVFRSGDLAAYQKYQRDHEDVPLDPGPAFPSIRRLLELNRTLDSEPVEVILLSRNDADSGLRIMNSIESSKLAISRAAFLDGEDPWHYMEPFNVALFLSGNAADIRGAIDNRLAGGHVLQTMFTDDEEDPGLRIAFDFDGVLADDEAENAYQGGRSDLLHQHEEEKAEIPLSPGPLKAFFEKIGQLQQLERQKQFAYTSYAAGLVPSVHIPFGEINTVVDEIERQAGSDGDSD